jgi:hypothetical protein
MTIILNGTTGITSPGLDASGVNKFATTISVGNATPSVSGAGITFPTTQNASSGANTLDDYEEGSWTPGIIAGGMSITSLHSAFYTKVGRHVTAYCYFNITNTGGLSGYQITGLPFINPLGYGPVNHYYGDGMNSGLALYIESGSSFAIINHPVPNGVNMGQMFMFTYFTL